MTLDRAVLAFAGFVVLVGIALSLTVHPYWLGLSAFAGLNLLQAAFTGSCPAGSHSLPLPGAVKHRP